MDLSNDQDRSILSVPLSQLGGVSLPAGAPDVTLAHSVLVATISMCILPMLGFPEQLKIPAAAVSLVITLWSIVHKGGLMDELFIAILGKEQGGYAREIVRPADMPAVWGAVGMMLGLGLGADTPVRQVLVYVAVGVAALSFVNLAFTLSKVEKLKKN